MQSTPESPVVEPRDSLVDAGIHVVDFGGLRIAHDARVLEPRPWTAAQSHWAAELLPGLPDGSVLELCAGAGQIGLLAVRHTDRRLVCVEGESVAAAFASSNALCAGMADRVQVREGDLRHALEPGERFPLVLADPPWVRRDEVSRFPDDPETAINGGADGLDVARDCLAVIRSHLSPGGTAILQLGSEEQCTLVEDMAGDLLRPRGRRVYPGQGVLLRLDRVGA